MYDEILNELGDLATVVSRNYVYGRIKDSTGLSIRHISGRTSCKNVRMRPYCMECLR